MASKLSIGISVITVIFSIIALAWFANSSLERTEQANEKLDEAIREIDRIVDKAIVHCQTDGTGCDVIMLEWSKKCKNSDMERIPSCHDGRIEQWLTKPTDTSEECEKLKEIMEQNRYGAENNDPLAISEFGMAMNEYNLLSCSK